MAQKAFLCRMKRERKTERKVNKQFCTDETKKKDSGLIVILPLGVLTLVAQQCDSI